MGYAPAQFYTVPFLVLHRAFTDFMPDKTKIKEFILHHLYLNCKAILNKIDKEGKEKVLEL